MEETNLDPRLPQPSPKEDQAAPLNEELAKVNQAIPPDRPPSLESGPCTPIQLSRPIPVGGVPQFIGDYEILGTLGRGGMGVVYKAKQRKLKRVVALKRILGGEHATDEDLRRFRQEAEASARLQHPNIVQIFEIGEHDGKPFFSLEYLDGGSLASKLANSPQAPFLAAHMTAILARAIHFAHLRGVIHRDLKPANILLGTPPADGSNKDAVTSFGVPKVTDFGLAKRMDIDLGQTQSGAILGTPSYMAPEQAGGRIREIGPATDIYGLGGILYDLLTGHPPFKANTLADTLRQVQIVEPVSPRRRLPGIPKDLNTICLKCLAKEPKKRYASALGLAEDLGRFLAGEPILARPVSRIERGVKWAKRRPAVAVAYALCFILPIIGVASLLREAINRKNLAAANFAEATASLLKHNNDGEFMRQSGKHPEADKALEAAEDACRQLLAVDKTNRESRNNLARILNNRAGNYQAWSNKYLPLAEQKHREALSIREKLWTEERSNSDYKNAVAESRYNLGVSLHDQNKPTEALQELGLASGLWRELAGTEMRQPYASGLALSLSASARAYGVLGKSTEADKDIDEALQVQARLISENEHDSANEILFADFYSRKADVLRNSGRLRESLPSYKKAEHWLERVYSHSKNVEARGLLRNVYATHATVVAMLDLIDEAETLAKQAEITGVNAYNLACIYARIHEALLRKGQNSARAQECATKAINLLETAIKEKFFDNEITIVNFTNDDDFNSLRGLTSFREVTMAITKAGK